MRRRGVAAAALVLVIGLLAVPAAMGSNSATDVLTGQGAVSATLAEVGTRSILAVGAVAFTGTAGGLSGALTSSYNVVVAEVARTGTNPWSITGQICGQDAGNAALSDCTTRGNNIYSGANSIPSSSISASSPAFAKLTNGATIPVIGGTVVGSGGGTAAAGSFTTLAATRTLGTNTGQSNLTLYSGAYNATGNLSLTAPDGTPVGTYLGYFVVTLIN